MSLERKLNKDIQRTKKKLIRDAEKLGLWENFGQSEVRRLESEYDANMLCYGTPEERQMYNQIDSFNDWCMNYAPQEVLT